MSLRISSGGIVLEKCRDVLIHRESDIVIGHRTIETYAASVRKDVVVSSIGKADDIIQTIRLYYKSVFTSS